MHRPTTLLAALAALALGLPAAATPADAAPTRTVDYAVVVEGTAEYNRADADEEASAQHDETVDFRTSVPKLTFIGTAAEDSRGALGTASVRRGSYLITGPEAQVRCAGHEIADVTAGGLDATFAPDRTVFAVRAIEAFTLRVGACDVGLPPWDVRFGSGGDPVGVGLFDGAFSLPHARIGEATMRFPLKGAVSGTSCPFNHSRTVLCSLTWDATVTFTRTGEGELPASPAVDEELIVPLVAKARLSRALTSAGLPVRCAAACRGTVTATAGGRTLARRAFTGGAGRSSAVTLRFDADDRRAIRRARGVRLALRATTLGGAVVRRTVALKATR